MAMLFRENMSKQLAYHDIPPRRHVETMNQFFLEKPPGGILFDPVINIRISLSLIDILKKIAIPHVFCTSTHIMYKNLLFLVAEIMVKRTLLKNNVLHN